MQWWCAAQDTAWSWSWQPYPGVWLFVAALAALLHRAQAGAVEAEETFSMTARRGFAAAGLLMLWAALDWPIGALGSGYLASVHMVQFLLIAVASPPLLLLSVPRSTWTRLTRGGLGRVLASTLGNPLAALFAFTAIMGFTHWPLVVDRLMAGQAGSFLLDVVWLFSGLVFWWPVAVALPEREWQKEPFKIGYLIAATLVNTGVFAFLTFSEVPVYATFELAPPVGSLSTRDDQLVAGLLMKVGGAVILWTSITILFFRWVGRNEREDAVERTGAWAGVIVLALAAAGCADAGTTLDGPVVIGEPVTAERAALYLTAVGGASDDRLVGLAVESVQEASLHRTETSGGMMRMQPVPEGFVVPAGGRLELRPGGAHAMLEGLAGAWSAGDSVEVTLRFESGDRVVWARVVPLSDLETVLR